VVLGKKLSRKLFIQNQEENIQPYIVVNCGAIPEGTIDSEFLGTKKEHLQATSTRKGYFEVADGGTIFLMR
jgi:DNA-binding NtrC family response regulator